MKMKTLISVVLTLLTLSLVTACGSAATPTAAPAAQPTVVPTSGAAAQPTVAPTAAKAKEKTKEKFSVALVLPGSISDKGFNQSGYEGLQMIKNKLGVKTAFSENTPVTEFKQVYRNYADHGYNVIIGHGFEFGDVALKVAPDYPKTYFVVTSNPNAAAPNVVSLQPKSEDAAYLAGVVAGLMTKSNKIGGVAGFDFPVIVSEMEAYKLGAKSVNPDVEVTLVYIGTFEDVGKAKEAALAQISVGADVMYHIADAAGLGVIQAAQEKGVYAIGWGKDQNAVAPKTVITSQIVDYARMMTLEVQNIMDGKFKGTVRFFGLKSGVVGLAPYHGLVPDEVASKVAKIKQEIIDGKLKVPFITKPTSK